MSMQSLPPRKETPNRPRSWRHPSSQSGRARVAPQARQSDCRPGAASSQCTVCEVVCADARHAVGHVTPDEPPVAASSQTCSSSESYAASADARGNASRSSHGNASCTRPAATPPCRSAPVGQRPSPAVYQKAPEALPPRSACDNVGTAVPSSPRSRRPPVRKALSPSTGSAHHKTSPSCGPVATSSGSSIRLQPEAENRTTRVLPNPDNSCATDTTAYFPWRRQPAESYSFWHGSRSPWLPFWRCCAASRRADNDPIGICLLSGQPGL